MVETSNHLRDRSIELAVAELPPSLAAAPPKPVGVIGAGGVASFAHLPAYVAAGIKVGLLYDIDPEGLARARAAVPASAKVVCCTEWDAMLLAISRRELSVLDVAVPTPLHFEVIGRLLDALQGNCPPILSQKPLAMTVDEARQLVDRADALGVPLAVNLNGRFLPTFAKAHCMLKQGAIGRPRFATITNRGLNFKRRGEWRGELQHLAGFEMAIHHLDLLCWMFGKPTWVFARMTNVPGFNITGDNLAHFTIGLGEDLISTVLEDWTCWEASATSYHPSGEEIVISGETGTMWFTPRELRLTRSDRSSQRFHTGARWFPDAFAGPMADLLDAIDKGTQPRLDARSHMTVLQLAEGAYASSREGRVIRLEEAENEHD